MAFVVGNRARVKLWSAALAEGTLNPQPPLIGLVQVVSGSAITVTFGGAAPPITVDAAFLDQITDTASNIRNPLLDQVVTGWVTPPNPPTPGVPYVATYTGRVVDVYTVNGGTRVLIRSLSNGMFYELPIANVSIIGDR